MIYDVIVVGAGASGMISAIVAAEKASSVLIIEQKEKAGKKILATGNGKCNYTNMDQTLDCYRSDDSTFVKKVLSNFDNHKTLEFFNRLGIYPKNRDGYIYPNSQQAASIVSVLLMECERLKINIIYNEKVTSITKPDYTITTLNPDMVRSIYQAKKVILATGGCASPKLGSDGSGYDLAKSFGHRIIKPLPALVSLKSPNKFCKTVSGVRLQAQVKAFVDSKILANEKGEIIFTDYGISGIPIMQLSRFVSRALDDNRKAYLTLDFFYQGSHDELYSLLLSRCNNNPDKTLEQMMIGLFNHKLNRVLIKETGLDITRPCSKVKKSDIDNLSKKIKNFIIRINSTNSFDFAQVTTGGIPVTEIDPMTMESKKKRGLYLTGELIDVDGTCGGYNLQWAWSTGYIAGSNCNK
ncbi:MAG: NAD(P)/FAD-dependent oxidoreductase [Clostridiales bacterium]|nr:NAD(P)/FAD-dependent oxidoreductase [Bacillota bacterium]NLK04486.1 NAD(P)/FAD-dependent oxidoreductase [Clostridiales bacterium]